MSLSEPDSLELKTSVPATWLPLAQLWQNAEQNLVGHCSEWDGKSGRVQSLHSPRMEEAQVRILEHIPGYACCLGVIIISNNSYYCPSIPLRTHQQQMICSQGFVNEVIEVAGEKRC